jgi:hypothetical protein
MSSSRVHALTTLPADRAGQMVQASRAKIDVMPSGGRAAARLPMLAPEEQVHLLGHEQVDLDEPARRVADRDVATSIADPPTLCVDWPASAPLLKTLLGVLAPAGAATDAGAPVSSSGQRGSDYLTGSRHRGLPDLVASVGRSVLPFVRNGDGMPFTDD